MPKSILKIFGENVRKYRLENGWSQEELARKCGLHRRGFEGVFLEKSFGLSLALKE